MFDKASPVRSTQVITSFFESLRAKILTEKHFDEGRCHLGMIALCMEEKVLPSYSLWAAKALPSQSSELIRFAAFIKELTSIRNQHYAETLETLKRKLKPTEYRLKRGYYSSLLYPESNLRFMKDVDIEIFHESTGLAIEELLVTELGFERWQVPDVQSNLYFKSLTQIILSPPDESISFSFLDELKINGHNYSPVLYIDVEIASEASRFAERFELSNNRECIALAVSELNENSINLKHLMDAFLARDWFELNRQALSEINEEMPGNLFYMSEPNRNIFGIAGDSDRMKFWSAFMEYLAYCETKYERYFK